MKLDKMDVSRIDEARKRTTKSSISGTSINDILSYIDYRFFSAIEDINFSKSKSGEFLKKVLIKFDEKSITIDLSSLKINSYALTDVSGRDLDGYFENVFKGAKLISSTIEDVGSSVGRLPTEITFI